MAPAKKTRAKIDARPESSRSTNRAPKAPARRDDVAFRELERDEIEVMLARNNVGRLAFSFHDRVDVQPIHYVYEHGWVYGRTSEGDKIMALSHNQWVAFEIDEIDGVFDWKSVVVHGSFWILHPRGSAHAEELWIKAAELVSKIVPGTLTENDPVSFRQTLFRIAVSDVRGREASTRNPERRTS
jgi:uncharacterized protein